MNWPYELQIGWRYTRVGRAGRRNRFISFISGVSMLGIALGVAALIIVLSVMNGFQKEVQNRMLSVIPHIEVLGAQGSLPDWRATAAAARRNPAVVGAAPFISTQALIARGDEMRGAIVRGISPADEATVTDLAAQLKDTTLKRLVPGEWGIVLGIELARSLDVRMGDKVTIVAPGGQVTPAGVLPRLKQFTVVGTFNAGHYEYDSGLAWIDLDDAARLFRLDGPSGVQLRLRDLHRAREVAAELAQSLGPAVQVRDWTRTNKNWFEAVQVEKRLMFIILTLIVAVAAFNLVSTLVMTVTDKRADIAILRTLGATPASVPMIPESAPCTMKIDITERGVAPSVRRMAMSARLSVTVMTSVETRLKAATATISVRMMNISRFSTCTASNQFLLVRVQSRTCTAGPRLCASSAPTSRARCRSRRRSCTPLGPSRRNSFAASSRSIHARPLSYS